MGVAYAIAFEGEHLMTAATKSAWSEPSPFHAAALDLLPYGLAMIPCQIDGKKPLVSRWNTWKQRPGPEAIEKFMAQHDRANIGIRCDLSGVTVIDVDGDHDLAATAIAMLGDTPLKICTPSGGSHHYYRYDGEACANLRRFGLDIDIKGKGGFVIVPPSIRLVGAHAGNRYKFITGSWADLKHLPMMTPLGDALDKADRGPSASLEQLRAVRKGRRNTTLFRVLLREARHVDDLNTLIDVGRTINHNFDDPLLNAEVVKTAKSAWNYQITESNWAGRSARAIITADDLARFEGNADAFMLLTYLELHHGARKEPFAIVSKAMDRQEVIPGWGTKRIANATRRLVNLSLLRQVHHGGRKRGDASTYVLIDHQR